MVVQVEKTPLIKIQIIDGVKLYNSDCVIVIAARPGIGKTNTACKIASQYAKSGKKTPLAKSERCQTQIIKLCILSIIIEKRNQSDSSFRTRFFVYCGHITLQSSFGNEQIVGNRLQAVLGTNQQTENLCFSRRK